jgi:hypothetical protein
VGCSAEGSNTVLGNGTPNVSANELLKIYHQHSTKTDYLLR